MALNPVPIGKQIADYLFANRPAAGDPPAGLPQIEALWEQIMTMIYADIKANMDVLPAGLTGPGLQTPNAIPGLVDTGVGAGGLTHTTAQESITGMGSVQ